MAANRDPLLLHFTFVCTSGMIVKCIHVYVCVCVCVCVCVRVRTYIYNCHDFAIHYYVCAHTSDTLVQYS